MRLLDPPGPRTLRARPCRTGVAMSTLPDIMTTRIIGGVPVFAGLSADPDPFAPARLSPVWGLTTWFGRLGLLAVVLVGILLVLPEDVRRTLGGSAGHSTFAADATQAARNAMAMERFAMGATKEQVRAIQGKPTREEYDAWWYGRAVVYFRHDRVVGWQDARPFVLKAEMPRAAHRFVRPPE